MLRRNIGGRSGIILDVCGTHGLWFDCDELSHLIAWMRNGGLDSVKADVGMLKGSPDTIRKRLYAESESKVTPPPVVSGSYGDPFGTTWGQEMRHPTGIDPLVEAAGPLIYAAGQIVAKLFSKY